MKLQFVGHESFICKHVWLKKGYDFVCTNGNFNDESAVIELGVGKNMAISISYWLKAFGIVDPQNTITELGKFLFSNKGGVDCFLESISSIWLLHYSLIKTNKASIYNLFFNEFKKGKIEFTKQQLLNFVRRKIDEVKGKNITENTMLADISVFFRNYLKPDFREQKIDLEEDFSNLMLDLEILEIYKSENAEGKLIDWYKAEPKNRLDLPFQLVFFVILDNDKYGSSISFTDLLVGYNSPGSIFLLSEESLYQKLKLIANHYPGIVYSETAGIRELQIKNNFNKWQILNDYYTA